MMKKPPPRNFIQLRPDAETRVMHRAVLVMSDDPVFEVIVHDASDTDIANGQDVLVYCERDWEFCAQPAVITSSERVPCGVLVTIEAIGDPIPAERRRRPTRLPESSGLDE